MGVCSSKEPAASPPNQNRRPSPPAASASPEPARAESKPKPQVKAEPKPVEEAAKSKPKPERAVAEAAAAAPVKADDVKPVMMKEGAPETKVEKVADGPEKKPETKKASKTVLAAQSSFMVEKRTVTERYHVGKELGRGCFGVVRVCTDKETGEQWALKTIQKSSLKSPRIVQDEVMQLKKVGQHPNVVQLHDFFEDFDGNFYIVMELCRGGDLFTRIVNQGSYSEQMASQLLRQLASAIKHMHDNKITHRDLKPENILLTDRSPGAPLKVVDFGLSKFVNSPQGMMSTVIGTWAYCAPEVFSRRPYTDTVDNWALGVLMFIMLSGYHPFDLYGDSSEAQLIDNICRGKFNFDEPEWQDVSEAAKSIITALLQKDPQKRMSVEAFLNSEWIVGQSTSSSALDRSQKRLQMNISSVFNLPPPLDAGDSLKDVPSMPEPTESMKNDVYE